MAIEIDSARVRFPPPFVYLGALMLGFGLARLLGRPGFGIGETAPIALGGVLFVAGAAFVLAAIGLFRKAGTNPEPWRPATSIVSTGIYRWTRNPMYLGMALVHAGIAVGFDSVVALTMLPAAMVVIQTQVIAREEAYLAAKFGEGYLGYKTRVRRWI